MEVNFVSTVGRCLIFTRQRLVMFNACCQTNKTKRDNDLNVLIANFTVETTKNWLKQFCTKAVENNYAE